MRPRPPSFTPLPAWPELDYAAWEDTLATFHLWTQVVGKIRLARMPWTNHSWHVTLHPTVRGLTTSPMPHGARSFQIDFDLIDHQVEFLADDGQRRHVALAPKTVADFHAEVMWTLQEMDLPVHIHTTPCEIPGALPFEEDHGHASYDAQAVERFHRALLATSAVFDAFRARFVGKCSPVHFFWGSFDLAVTRFSGRSAPRHPAGIPNLPDWVAREAYSHEVSSAGFWPGGEAHPEPVFYSYAYPAPDGFAEAAVAPDAAAFDEDLQEFVLPYEAVRSAPDPEAALMAFLESTYVAAADRAGWDRAALELGDPRTRYA